MFHEEGESTDVTGTEVVVKASIIEANGSLTSPAKLKPELDERSSYFIMPVCRGCVPKIASTMWFETSRADLKSSVKGIFKFFSCAASRC